MSWKSHPLLRAVRLLAGRLGRARPYALGFAVVVLVLAFVGLVKLVTPARDHPPVVSQSTQTPTPSVAPAPSSPAPPRAAQEPLIAIRDITSRRHRLRGGARLVAARIAVVPQTRAKVADVEIRVFFYDVTRDGEMRPTAAEVAYEWLTPVRDWSDPSPKYLVATYLRPRQRRNRGERLRYGGCIVQVYANGQLQHERSEPEQILAALRRRPGANATPPVAESTPLSAMPDPAAEHDEDDEEPLVEPDSSPIASPAATTPTLPPRQPAVPSPTSTASSSGAPLGKPARGKPGFIYSADDEKFVIDVRGIPSGTEITDPYTGKPLRVP